MKKVLVSGVLLVGVAIAVLMNGSRPLTESEARQWGAANLYQHNFSSDYEVPTTLYNDLGNPLEASVLANTQTTASPNGKIAIWRDLGATDGIYLGWCFQFDVNSLNSLGGESHAKDFECYNLNFNKLNSTVSENGRAQGPDYKLLQWQ